MKGVGSYNDWSYYALPSSNLSAFAAPFSVHRSTSDDVSAPFTESAESADAVPSIHYQSYGYDFFSNPVRELDSSKPYAYSGLESLDSHTGQFPPPGLPPKDHSPKSSFVEAQPYYPSYVSSTTQNHSSSVTPNHWSPCPGFPSLDGSSFGDFAYKPFELGFVGQHAVPWNQNPNLLPEFKGKQVGLGNSFSSMHTDVTLEERMNQGYQDVKDSNNNDWSKHGVPAATNQLDDKSCCWQTVKPIKIEFSGASVMQPLPIPLQTHHESPLKLVADSRKHPLSYTDSCNKDSSHGDNPPRVDTLSSMPRTEIVTDLNIGNMTADGEIGHNNFYNINEEAYHMPSSESGTPCFDVGLLRRHLERNEPSSSKSVMGSDKNVSRDVADHISKGRSAFQNPYANMDNLSLRLSAVEDLNSVEKSFEDGDRCNPAVDSPCWKGASAHISQYGSYEVMPPGYVHKNDFQYGSCEVLPPGCVHKNDFQYGSHEVLPPGYVRKSEECLGSAILKNDFQNGSCEVLPLGYVHNNEECFGSVIQEHQNYLLDIENNVKKSCENSNSYQMHAETIHRETNSAGSPGKFSSTKFCKSDCAVDAGSSQIESGCDFGFQCTNDSTKMKEISMPSLKPTDCESVSSHMKRQVAEEKELISQQQHTSSIGNADPLCNVNKCLEDDISHIAEHGLSSSSSGAPTITMSQNSSEKVLPQKLNVQMLVDTMQNLSELLLGHCLNNDCELNKQEHNVLQNVISNLNSCALKNAEQSTPAETSNCAEESWELEQNASFKRPQLTKIGPESSKVEFENPLVAEANLCFGKISDTIFLGNDAEMAKTDNMTKALKRILNKNFHDDEGAEPQALLYKNLWLEAEAALCSIHYKARYNQMKIEMDKHSYKERGIKEQSKSDVIPTLSQIQLSATEVNNYPKTESSNKDLPGLDATNLKELSDLKSSTDMNRSHAMIHEEKGSQNLSGFFQNYTVSNIDKETGTNDEASVMARYHVLKARANRSPATILEEPSDIAGKLVAKRTEDRNQVNIGQDSPIPDKAKTDYEASVVARFHILKSCLEDSSSISSEGKQLSGVGSVAKGMNDTNVKDASEGKSLDACVNLTGVHLNSYTGVDKSIPKEFHLDWEGHQEILPRGTYEFQLPIYYSDGLASDWEHVEKNL